MTDKQTTRLCPVCTDGKIVCEALGQRVKTTCRTCNGALFIPADHPVFEQQPQPAASQPTA